MTELKPCPFCGQIPIIEESARFPRYGKDEGKRIKGYTVVCKNLYCILHNADDWYRRSAKEASEAWNRRAEPENRPLTLEEVVERILDDDWNFVWVEWLGAVAPEQMCPWQKVKKHIVFLNLGREMYEVNINIVGYGKTWRCWPRKPTPEQMAAEKWEE